MDKLQLIHGGRHEPAQDVKTLMRDLGSQARKSSRALALAPSSRKNLALMVAAASVRTASSQIVEANELDIKDAEAAGATPAALDRLKLDAARIEAIAKSLEDIAALPDPVGRVLARFDRPNGLRIEQVATPIGVVGVIYESRPNVTADAGALCLKSGNAAILRGGSDSFRSSTVIHACLVEGLRSADLPEAAIQRVPTRERAAVGEMLRGLDGDIDVIIPRGGKSLVARVQEEARVPVFAHLEGVVHVYVDGFAELEKAKAVVLNSKMRRTGVCGAAETLLVDQFVVKTHLAPLVRMLLEAGCEVRGDSVTQRVDPRVKAAVEQDWRAEYLDAIVAVRVVNGIDEAIDHIEGYGSHHTDCIVTENANVAQRFLAEVDSAIVLHNASTQFADGGEFGFGAEIGIATGRLHARGPVGLEQLTSFKYCVYGDGQTRA